MGMAAVGNRKVLGKISAGDILRASLSIGRTLNATKDRFNSLLDVFPRESVNELGQLPDDALNHHQDVFRVPGAQGNQHHGEQFPHGFDLRDPSEWTSRFEALAKNPE
jgi:hypothetical protein